MKVFITPKELSELKEAYVLLDGRGHMGMGGRSFYEIGHIQGAHEIALEWDMADPAREHGGRHPLPEDLSIFKGYLETLGISNDTLVVIYDSWASTVGRLWWMLHYVGVHHVLVLAGGIERWHREGYPLVSEETPIPNVGGHIEGDVTPNWLVNHQEALAISEAGDQASKVLVDVRAPMRYRGETEPLDPVAGHIPGAYNVFYEMLYTADGTIPVESIREAFAKVLATKRDIVVYCGSGVTAPIAMMAMAEADIPASLYLGSFSDWISYDDAKVETGTR